MKNFLILFIGIILGGIFMTMLMCCLQIDRINKYEEKINYLKSKRTDNR